MEKINNGFGEIKKRLVKMITLKIFRFDEEKLLIPMSLKHYCSTRNVV